MKIYHFLNLGFGLPFLKSYALLSHHIKCKTSVTIVVSGKDCGLFETRNPIKRIKNLVLKLYRQQLLRHQIGNRLLKFRIVVSVNQSRFIHSIPSGTHAICSGFNQIFSGKLIGKFHSFVNFHPSILPLYRGPVPSYWCIENREKFSGFTLHEVTEEIDKGPILYQEAIEIGGLGDPDLLDQKIAERAIPVFHEYLECIVERIPFERKDLLASEYYYQKVSYQSFPD